MAPLGYLGSLSQKGHPKIFSKWVLINLSNPLRHPATLVDPLLTKNLDTVGPWCVFTPDAFKANDCSKHRKIVIPNKKNIPNAGNEQYA